MLVVSGCRRGQHHHRRVRHVSGADAVGEVQHAGAVGDQAYGWRAGDAAVTVGHQSRALLVPHADKLHVGAVIERVQHVQEGRTDDAENLADAFLLQQFNDRFAGFHSLGH